MDIKTVIADYTIPYIDNIRALVILYGTAIKDLYLDDADLNKLTVATYNRIYELINKEIGEDSTEDFINTESES